MAQGVGINGTQGVHAALPGTSGGSQASEAAAKLPAAPTNEVQSPATRATTGFSNDPAVATTIHSKVVQRLLQQNARIHSPGLAQVPLPPRPDGTPRTAPKKPAGPMVAPRSLDGGMSPLATSSLWDARKSIGALGTPPSLTPGES